MTQTFVWSPPGLYSISVLLLLCCVPRSWTEPKYLSPIEVPQYLSTTVPRYCQYQSTREQLAPSVIRRLLSSPVKKSSCPIYLWHFWICSACHQTVICVIKLMSTTMCPDTAFRRRVCFWLKSCFWHGQDSGCCHQQQYVSHFSAGSNGGQVLHLDVGRCCFIFKSPSSSLIYERGYLNLLKWFWWRLPISWQEWWQLASRKMVNLWLHWKQSISIPLFRWLTNLQEFAELRPWLA